MERLKDAYYNIQARCILMVSSKESVKFLGVFNQAFIK